MVGGGCRQEKDAAKMFFKKNERKAIFPNIVADLFLAYMSKILAAICNHVREFVFICLMIMLCNCFLVILVSLISFCIAATFSIMLFRHEKLYVWY